MSSYNFTDDAIQDINEICDYLSTKNYTVASRFFDTVRQKCKVVANFPNMGKSYEYLSPKLRGFIVDDYIIFYYPTEDGINVARILSGYRDFDAIFLPNENN
jgi:toxin ParE1/3/4